MKIFYSLDILMVNSTKTLQPLKYAKCSNTIVSHTQMNHTSTPDWQEDRRNRASRTTPLINGWGLVCLRINPTTQMFTWHRKGKATVYIYFSSYNITVNCQPAALHTKAVTWSWKKQVKLHFNTSCYAFKKITSKYNDMRYIKSSQVFKMHVNLTFVCSVQKSAA